MKCPICDGFFEWSETVVRGPMDEEIEVEYRGTCWNCKHSFRAWEKYVLDEEGDLEVKEYDGNR